LETRGLRVLDLGRQRCAIVTVEIPVADRDAFKARLDEHRVNSSLSEIGSARFDFADKGIEWALRLSPHAYNTEDEVVAVADAVLSVIDEMTQTG
jgi:selenocysteine lyase/cysteine desulfurase